jgi:hypothetical protein
MSVKFCFFGVSRWASNTIWSLEGGLHVTQICNFGTWKSPYFPGLGRTRQAFNWPSRSHRPPTGPFGTLAIFAAEIQNFTAKNTSSELQIFRVARQQATYQSLFFTSYSKDSFHVISGKDQGLKILHTSMAGDQESCQWVGRTLWHEQ